jgi:hypothetical protein
MRAGRVNATAGLTVFPGPIRPPFWQAPGPHVRRSTGRLAIVVRHDTETRIPCGQARRSEEKHEAQHLNR